MEDGKIKDAQLESVLNYLKNDIDIKALATGRAGCPSDYGMNDNKTYGRSCHGGCGCCWKESIIIMIQSVFDREIIIKRSASGKSSDSTSQIKDEEAYEKNRAALWMKH